MKKPYYFKFIIKIIKFASNLQKISKINKTFYLIISCINSRSDFHYVHYKTKKEKDLTREIGLLRNKIVTDGYFFPPY
mgnify:CR=1 FL=1